MGFTNVRTRTKEVMFTLLKTVILQVEYGCITWMLTSQNSVNVIQSIQLRFTKMTDWF